MTPLETTWQWLDTHTIVGIVAILVVAVISHIIVITLIKRFTKRMRVIADQPEGTLAHRAASALGSATGAKPGRTLIHVTALAHLLKSIWTIVLVIVVLLAILMVLQIPIAPFLTSAGIGGVVLAFGAQSLIKDYLSGIAMIVEDQFGVGDQITVGDITGTVENVTLRITKLRDVNGMIWYIRNGEILKIANISQGYSIAFVDVPVAYDADVSQVTDVLTSVVEELATDDTTADQLLEPPELLGVESITATTLTMRIRLKTPPNKQYALARDVRERAIGALSDTGIPGPNIMPFPTPDQNS